MSTKMSKRLSISLTATISSSVGVYLGFKLGKNRVCNDDFESESRKSIQDFLPIPIVHAASAPTSNVTPFSQQFTSLSSSRSSEIMKYGYPSSDNVRTFENFVVSYDRRNRTANWVFEHLKPEHLVKNDGIDRSKSNFEEDKSVHPYFRSTNKDYSHSGYDRGHLAAAGNHRHSQRAMDQTFTLSNIAPQVGKGFNRDIWNSLESFVRSIARKSRNVYVCTGPLYLPRREENGKLYVKYEVIGQNNVAVPTHFFKVLLIENDKGQYELLSFVFPNQVLPSDDKLKKYLVPVESIERAAGILLFEKIPKKMLCSINGKKT